MIYKYDKEDKVLLAVDCIIFGFNDKDLKILLIKRGFEPEKGKWSLVGGFMKKDEVLDDAASRILKLYTGLDDIYMEQLQAFSEVDRDPVERTISVAYYALIDIKSHEERLIKQFSANWFNVFNAPKLIFDHDKMVNYAIKRLRRRASTRPIGFELLPEKFTMRQLQELYEAIWNTSLDKRNFISKIRSLDFVQKLNEKDMNSSRKGSYLYRFDPDKYNGKRASGFSLRF